MTRIVVIANNEAGVIADIAGALADRNINIETMSTEALGEKGAITLTTDDYDGALRALTDAGFKTVSDDSLILRLHDEPGALAKVAEKFKQGGVNIQSLHILDRRNGHTTRRRPRQSGVAGGAGDGSVGGKTRGVTYVGSANALIGPTAMPSIYCTARLPRRAAAERLTASDALNS